MIKVEIPVDLEEIVDNLSLDDKLNLLDHLIFILKEVPLGDILKRIGDVVSEI